MTEAQKELREERIAIMMHLGVASEEEANAFCDQMPELYGIRAETLEQGEMFPARRVIGL